MVILWWERLYLGQFKQNITTAADVCSHADTREARSRIRSVECCLPWSSQARRQEHRERYYLWRLGHQESKARIVTPEPQRIYCLSGLSTQKPVAAALTRPQEKQLHGSKLVGCLLWNFLFFLFFWTELDWISKCDKLAPANWPAFQKAFERMLCATDHSELSHPPLS